MRPSLQTYPEDAKGRTRLTGNIEDGYTTLNEWDVFRDSVREDFFPKPLAA